MTTKTEYKLNRLETTKSIGPMVDQHWKELREAKKEGMFVAWCSGPLFIFPYAMKMKCHFMAGYAAYCAGRGAGDQVLEVAEADGELPDTCSYHRLHMGMAAAVRKGIPIREEVILPMPDLMIDGRGCTEMSHYAEALYRQLGINVVAVDIPPVRRDEDIPRVEKYVENQIRETLIPTMEKATGRPFDYDHMSEILTVLKEAATLRNECWKFFEKIPSPWTLWDYGVSIAPVFYLMGKPETIPYYEKLLAELKERGAKNVSSIMPQENYRLYWDGWLPWAFLGIFMRKLIPFGAVPICGRYPWEFFPHPEAIEPEPDPVHNFVQMLYTHRMFTRNVPDYALPFIGELIEKYFLDAMIMFSSKSCRMWNLGQPDIVSEIEKKYGVPGIIIDADMIDSRMFSEAQIDTRLNALFELVEGRRRFKR
jgi:benzoyl-CoA reductase/2-hydroxyglutaryl-CoA dehydratase subunit BcrC/BadD/HgdB